MAVDNKLDMSGLLQFLGSSSDAAFLPWPSSALPVIQVGEVNLIRLNASHFSGYQGAVAAEYAYFEVFCVNPRGCVVEILSTDGASTLIEPNRDGRLCSGGTQLNNMPLAPAPSVATVFRDTLVGTLADNQGPYPLSFTATWLGSTRFYLGAQKTLVIQGTITNTILRVALNVYDLV